MEAEIYLRLQGELLRKDIMFASNDQAIKRNRPVAQSQSWVRGNGHSPKAQAAVSVFVEQYALMRVSAHARSDMNNEVGGWLAGSWCWDANSKQEFIVVEAVIPAKAVRQGSTFITFTHESQVEMLSVLEGRYPGKKIVGWYHTHPRMGIFLSEHDLWLHKQFFPRTWQVALVVEPHSCAGGFFIRNQNKHLDPHAYYGFQEILPPGRGSKSHWQNLVKDTEAKELEEMKT